MWTLLIILYAILLIVCTVITLYMSGMGSLFPSLQMPDDVVTFIMVRFILLGSGRCDQSRLACCQGWLASNGFAAGREWIICNTYNSCIEVYDYPIQHTKPLTSFSIPCRPKAKFIYNVPLKVATKVHMNRVTSLLGAFGPGYRT